MNPTTELFDPKTQMELRQAAPQVTNVPWDLARKVVKGLEAHGEKTTPHKDPSGKIYWEASLKEIREAGEIGSEETLSNNRIGRACKIMGLTGWRETDGYHVAWSKDQLDILKKYFKL